AAAQSHPILYSRPFLTQLRPTGCFLPRYVLLACPTEYLLLDRDLCALDQLAVLVEFCLNLLDELIRRLGQDISLRHETLFDGRFLNHGSDFLIQQLDHFFWRTSRRK